MTLTKQDITTRYNTFFSTNKTYDKLSKEEIQLIAQILDAENTGSGGGSVSGSVKIIDSDNDELKITSTGKLDINSISSIPLASNAATESTLSTLNNKFSTATGRLLTDGSQVTQPVSIASLPVLPTGTNTIGSIANTTFSSTQSGIWSFRNQDGSGNVLTSQVNGSQRALDIGINVSGNQIDPRQIRVLTSGDVVSTVQNGTWNLANITGTISLPTGASTESTLSALSAKLPSALVSGRLSVDGSGVTQPISATTLPLPSGAATSAKQPNLGTAGTASTDVLTVQGIASMTALKVDGSATTQPVSISSLPSLATGSNVIGSISNTSFASTQSGTWNINNVSGTISLPTGASTSALQTTGNTSLNSIDSKTPGYGTAGNSNANVLTVQGISNGTSINTYTIGTNIFGTTTTSTFSASTTSGSFTIPQKFAAAIIPVISTAPTITVQVTLDSGTTWTDTSVQVVSSASVPTIIECDSFARLAAFTALSNAFRFKSSSSITATINIRYTHA